ncbi:unnamed protein product, partial [Mycena citricolor]
TFSSWASPSRARALVSSVSLSLSAPFFWASVRGGLFCHVSWSRHIVHILCRFRLLGILKRTFHLRCWLGCGSGRPRVGATGLKID